MITQKVNIATNLVYNVAQIFLFILSAKALNCPIALNHYIFTFLKSALGSICHLVALNLPFKDVAHYEETYRVGQSYV